jgi:hypothetical protein
MLDAVVEGILEARLLDHTVGTDAPGDLDADAIAREKGFGREFPTLSLGHPRCIHKTSVTAIGFVGHKLESSPKRVSNLSVRNLYDRKGLIGLDSPRRGGPCDDHFR